MRTSFKLTPATLTRTRELGVICQRLDASWAHPAVVAVALERLCRGAFGYGREVDREQLLQPASAQVTGCQLVVRGKRAGPDPTNTTTGARRQQTQGEGAPASSHT